MNESRLNQARTNIIMIILAIVALGLAVWLFYTGYFKTRTARNVLVPSTDQGDMQQINGVPDYFKTLNQQNYLVTITPSDVSANIQSDISNILNSKIYIQSGVIRRIDFVGDNKSVLYDGNIVTELDNTNKTAGNFSAASDNQSLISFLANKGFRVSDTTESALSGLNFTRTSSSTWESTNPIIIKNNGTDVPVLIQLYTNDSTGFIDGFSLVSKDGTFSQKYDVGYSSLSDQDLKDALTVPPGYTPGS